MADKGFTEQYVDYSAGRENAPTLTVMVGVSGSGKSTLAKAWVTKSQGNLVRFNRDEIRNMLFVDAKWSSYNEEVTRRHEQEGVKLALRMGRNVIVDDTNVVARTRYGWEELARDCRVIFRQVVMTITKEECIERDSKRVGKACVGVDVIEKQFKQLGEGSVTPRCYQTVELNRAVLDRDALRGGELKHRLPGAPWVFFDLDGTVFSHIRKDGSIIRSPFDESRVLEDEVFPVVVEWIRALYPFFNLGAVSGRHDTCSEGTAMALDLAGVPFDVLLMRPAGNNDKDYVIKKEILDELLAVLPKEKIAFWLDDRPQVVRMWRENGIKVYPVAGTTDHSPNCTYQPVENKRNRPRRCPECGALEDF